MKLLFKNLKFSIIIFEIWIYLKNSKTWKHTCGSMVGKGFKVYVCECNVSNEVFR